jgi:Mrp family chromosome partitioning ATPase
VRQPGFGRLLGADAGLGLTDHLLGHATLEQVVQQDTLTGMKFIAAGSAEAGSRTLFASEAMTALLAKLANEYDLVLLDVPPAAAMTDARVIAAQADTTLLLVRWHHTPRGVTRHAIRVLEEAGARISGIALTRVDAKAHVRSGYADAEVYHPRYGGYFRE